MKQNESTTNLLRSISVVMILFVVSRALGLVREAVIAHQFGTSGEMDAYLAAFRLPDFLFYVVSGGALGSAFMPTFTGYLARQDMDGAWYLASAVINCVVLVLTILGGLSALFAPWLVSTFYPELSPTQQILTIELMRWMLISTIIFGVSGVAMGILNAHQHFLLPALAPIIYNLGIILGAWLLGPSWGVRGLTVGVVFGSIGHLLIQLPGLVSRKMRYRPVLGWHNEGVREVIRLMTPRMVGIAAIQINFVVNTILAARLTTGSLTALNYGWIIMLLPQGIIAQSVATALFPTLAALVAQGKREEMQHIFAQTLQSLLFLTLPATVGLIMWSGPIVRLLLERGKFGADSTRLTVWALNFFALGLVSHSIVEITTRAFYALKNTKTPVAIGVVTMGLNLGLSVALMRLFAHWGYPPHGGLALANSIAVTIEMVALLLLLRPEMGHIVKIGFGQSLAKMGLATAGMAMVLLFLPTHGSWLVSLSGIGLGGTVYFGLAYALGMKEMLFFKR